MLGGRMSNQDEDEVEDELEALEKQVAGVKLPPAPQGSIVGEGTLPDAPQETPAEKAKRRREARAREQARQPIAA